MAGASPAPRAPGDVKVEIVVRPTRRAAVICLLWFGCHVIAAAGALAQDASPRRGGGVPIWTQAAKLFSSLFSGVFGHAEEECGFDELILRQVEPAARDIVIPPKKKAWENALGGEEAARPHIRARLVGWPSRAVVNRETLPATDEEFLARVARDTWAGLEAFTDRENGLPIDNVRFGQASVAPDDARVGDYTSVATVGLQLMAVAAAYELRFISAEDALAKIQRVLDTMSRLETYQGFFFNYYDTTSLERTSNFISFVDSSWLTAGLMVARMTFPALDERCTRIIEAGDYRFFSDDSQELMSHGYYVHRASRSRYHYGVLYAESRLGSLIAIGKGEAPEAHWFHMIRTFPAACAWQGRVPQRKKPKVVRGYPLVGGYYEWQGVRYVPSWGGSMFEALMPTLVLEEPRHAPRSLGANDAAHAVIQRRYAIEELGYPVWGMSSSSTAAGDDYSEYGVKVLGSAGYKAGVVTPHAAALALSVTPEPAIANLRALAELYDIYGEYGFYDAVDPRSGQVAYTYLALDQSMTFIALANHLNDHCIQKRFASDPIAQRALPVLGDEDFFE